MSHAPASDSSANFCSENLASSVLDLILNHPQNFCVTFLFHPPTGKLPECYQLCSLVVFNNLMFTFESEYKPIFSG